MLRLASPLKAARHRGHSALLAWTAEKQSRQPLCPARGKGKKKSVACLRGKGIQPLVQAGRIACQEGCKWLSGKDSCQLCISSSPAIMGNAPHGRETGPP